MIHSRPRNKLSVALPSNSTATWKGKQKACATAPQDSPPALSKKRAALPPPLIHEGQSSSPPEKRHKATSPPLDQGDKVMSPLIYVYIKWEAYAASLTDQVKKIERQRQDLKEQIMQNLDLTDPIRKLLEQLMKLELEHTELLTKMLEHKGIKPLLISQIYFEKEFVVNSLEDARVLVNWSQDHSWKGTAIIPLSVPNVLREDIEALCSAAQVRIQLQN